ncbi:ABC transporter permease [Nocardioides sp. zg-ZUI104]|uniref:ABC transporter permease n=1 Tax=Nocardioides faecalis TaxID=2803858 RepID=UPI001BCAAA3D|nr:ABC transporter permease [Nocardioides faecalis]MBS4754619.1 ABC transporter permease [Nocardioides faecalis]
MNAIVNSTRAELLRMRKWPAVWVTLGAWLALAAMFGYIFDYIAYATGDNSFSNEGEPAANLLAGLLPANVPSVLIQGTPMFGGALMMVLGALVAGSGYGWGTWKTVFTQGPSRISATLGSMAALALIVAGLVLVTLILCFAISLGVAGLESQSVVWPGGLDLLEGVGTAYGVLGMWTLAGFLLGTIARSAGLSVGLGLVWALVLENLLRGVGTLLSPVAVFTHFLPGTAAGSLVGSIVGVDSSGDTTPGVLDTLMPGRAVATVLAYVVVLGGASLLLVRRRDVA